MKKYGVAFIFVAVVVLVMLMTPFSSVTAQPMCGPKPAMVETILNKFNEKETEYGIDGLPLPAVPDSVSSLEGRRRRQGVQLKEVLPAPGGLRLGFVSEVGDS